MGERPVKRSMNEFLINPTVPMEDSYSYGESSSPTRNSIPFDPANALSTVRRGKKTLDAAATIRGFDNDAGCWRGYASDEEIASPVDNDDDFTFDSTSSDDDESIASIHEAQYHTQTCNNAQQLCNRAQAVQLVSAGKAKVVSMPKIVDVPATYSPQTHSSQASGWEADSRRTASHTSQVHPHCAYSSISSSSRSSGEDSLYSSLPIPRAAQPTGARFVRRKPSLPRLQTTARSYSPQSADSGSEPKTAFLLSRSRLNFLDYDPFTLEYSVHVTANIPPPKRKLQRLSPTFSFKSLSRSLRRNSTSDGSSGEGGVNKKDISRPMAQPVIADMHIPSRTSSRPPPKMVARGADERAAAIEIPPCPAEYQDDTNVPAWPPRSDSAANNESTWLASRLHGRRKSLSAFVSTRA
jgi:hypothetical protein